MKICDSCGDSYSAKQKSYQSIKQQAQAKADEEKQTYAICEEAGNIFCSPMAKAWGKFLIKEAVSPSHGLQDNA